MASLVTEEEYNKDTEIIIRRVLQHNGNCIDVGCHKGSFLKIMLEAAPNGNHYAFEPIPQLFDSLYKQYNSVCHILPYALTDFTADAEFCVVTHDLGYSGMREREFPWKDPGIKKISVKGARLDDVRDPELPVQVIKMDIEGAEYSALTGATQTIQRWHPLVLFEFGLGGADYYGVTANLMYDLFNNFSLKVSLLSSYINNQSPLTKSEFRKQFDNGLGYFYVAHPKTDCGI